MPRRGKKWEIASASLCMLALAAAISQTICAAKSASEYEVKAAFLLNFTKFVDWPPSAFADPKSPLQICILGNDPFGSALDQLVQGETTNDRQIVPRRILQLPAPHTCQVLFVDPQLKDVAKILKGIPPGILTVGEGDRFIREGGMIALVLDNRRVRFDINQGAAENAGLKLSAKLLNVARSVTK